MRIIREADFWDRERALAVTLSSYSEYEATGSPEFWQRYRENIAKTILEDKTVTILLAEEDNAIQGSVLLCPPGTRAVSNPFPEMRLLAVPQEFRNRGIANSLIEECEWRASKNGVLTLHTTKLMETARAMYERRGYTRFPEIDFEPVPGVLVWGYKKILDRNSNAKGESANDYVIRTEQTAVH